jgi:hypothetical protein
MRFSPGFWRKCRAGFRWLRIAILLAVLALVCALLWFNRIGLPDFLKRPLVERLHAQGVELQFARLRLHFVHGLVAENVIAGQASASETPTLSAAEVQLRLDYHALWHRRLEIRGLTVRQGKLTWPLTPTNVLTLENIHTELRFQTNDTWSLDHFQADYAGAKLALAGEIAHAPDIRNWSIFQGLRPAGPSQPPTATRKFTDALGRIRFLGATRLNLNLTGDARDPHSFVIRLVANAPAVQTPWGGARNIVWDVNLAVPAGASPPADGNFASTWGWWTNLQPYRLTYKLRLAHLRSGKLDADTVVCAGSWLAPELEVTNLFIELREGRLEARARLHFRTDWPRPPSAHLDFNAPVVEGSWGNAHDIRLAADLAMDTPAHFDPAWGWWTNAQPYRASWTLQAAQLRSSRLNADMITGGGFWLAPELAVTNFSASLRGGRFDAQARLNVATRELAFTNQACFDFHTVAALLPEQPRNWLSQVSWQRPPSIMAGGTLMLPAWTNHPPGWLDGLQPPTRLAGEFAFTNSAFHGVAFDSVRGHFSRSNSVWRVPDLALVRTNATLVFACLENDTTKDFQGSVHGALDPNVIRPLMGNTNATQVLNLFSLTAPLLMDVGVCGNLRDYHSIGIHGTITLTNFVVRGEAMESLQTRAAYTNRILQFFEPNLRRSEGQLTAGRVTVDFNAQRVYITNGFSTADPRAVTHAIGPETEDALAPYHFLLPPTVRVNGYAPLRGNDDADVTFDVDGGPFEWIGLKSPHVAGQVHWLGQTLILTNVTAALYGGNGAGWGNLDFSVPHKGADYCMAGSITNVNLHLLASDFSSGTNHLEGALSGTLTLTHADTRDWRTPDGFGNATLRDGLLWDFPIFGMLSPVLNTISPNLGYSRATEARAAFVMTNGVIYSDSLGIHSTMMQLQYAGTVDLRGNVNARVTAQLLRNTWVVGPLVSTVLWPVSKLFEYKVTGTLDQPKAKPVYVPRFLLMPLHPIRSLEELFPANDSFSSPPPGK